MAYKVVINQLDGIVREVLPSARARIDAERHFGGLSAANAQEATIYMAWAHLQKSGEVDADFETWIDTLADVEEVEVKEPRPTQPAQPADTSSD